MNMLMAEGSWAVWSWNTDTSHLLWKVLGCKNWQPIISVRKTRQADGTYGAGVEALEDAASLSRHQRHVLAEARVEAEGEREAASHPLPLLEASCRCLHIQQHLRAVVVGERHAAHQPEETGRQVEVREGDGRSLVGVVTWIPTPGSPTSVRCGCDMSSGSRLEVCSRFEPRCRSAPPRWCPLAVTTQNSNDDNNHTGISISNWMY